MSGSVEALAVTGARSVKYADCCPIRLMDVTSAKFLIISASLSVIGLAVSEISHTTFAPAFSCMAASVLSVACKIMFVLRIMLLTKRKINSSSTDFPRFRIR